MFQPYDPVIVRSRRAVFLWYAFRGRNYARVRFPDGIHATVPASELQSIATACANAVRDLFLREENHLAR